jgi:monoamine oxidase
MTAEFVDCVYCVTGGEVAGAFTASSPFSDQSHWPTGYCQFYAGYEGARQGNTHLAGEHCSIDFQGYMEGGAQEGQRAAAEVLGDYGLK